MKLRRSNLRQMMNEGLVNDQIRRQVLEGLKRVVLRNDFDNNGDLKERVNTYQHLIKHKF